MIENDFMILNISAAVIAVFFGLHLAQAVPPSPGKVMEKKLNQCLEKYPSFLNALLILSDKEIRDSSLTAARKVTIRQDLQKDPSGFTACLRDFLKAAHEMGPAAEADVILRTKEISEVLEESAPARTDDPGRS